MLPERCFLQVLGGVQLDRPTVPAGRAGCVPEDSLDHLNAFDLVHLEDGQVRFADAVVLRSATTRLSEGAEMLPLPRHRDAPTGRHWLVRGADGNPPLA